MAEAAPSRSKPNHRYPWILEVDPDPNDPFTHGAVLLQDEGNVDYRTIEERRRNTPIVVQMPPNSGQPSIEISSTPTRGKANTTKLTKADIRRLQNQDPLWLYNLLRENGSIGVLPADSPEATGQPVRMVGPSTVKQAQASPSLTKASPGSSAESPALKQLALQTANGTCTVSYLDIVSHTTGIGLRVPTQRAGEMPALSPGQSVRLISTSGLRSARYLTSVVSPTVSLYLFEFLAEPAPRPEPVAEPAADDFGFPLASGSPCESDAPTPIGSSDPFGD